MRFKKVLLVFPAFESDTGSSRPSPSISYLAQELKEQNIEYDVIDMKLGYGRKDLMRKIRETNPDIIGFTVFTLHHQVVYGIVAQIKENFPEVKIIVGGPHISIRKEKVLSDCAAIDFACVGEGEELLAELCKGKDLSEILGLVYKEKSNIMFTGSRPYQENLDKFGFPRLERFELDKYANEVFIVSSRGCPYSCIYCSVHIMLGKKLRYRSAEKVVDELEYWHKRGRRIFNFIDDNFTFYKERVYDICGEIERRSLKGLILRASNGVRADRLDYDLLKRMKEVGFISIGIGVEAGNNKVLGILKKGETIEAIEAAIKTACELGYEVGLFFVFGAPGETVRDVNDSINLALKYDVFKVDFYNLIPFPGTELYEWVERNNAWVGDPSDLLDRSCKNIRFGSSPFYETKELSLSVQIALNRKLLKVMRVVERRYLTGVLKKKIGLLAHPLSRLINTRFVQFLYFNNNTVRRYAENMRFRFLGR